MLWNFCELVTRKYATTHKHPPSATTQNHQKPSTTTQKTFHNHPQPSATTKNIPKNAITCTNSYLSYCTLDVNTETDVDFDSDMKQ